MQLTSWYRFVASQLISHHFQRQNHSLNLFSRKMTSWAGVSKSFSPARVGYCNCCQQLRARIWTEIRCCLVPKSTLHQNDFHKAFDIHRNRKCLQIWSKQGNKNLCKSHLWCPFTHSSAVPSQPVNNLQMSCAKTRNILQNSQIAHYDRTRHKGLQSTFVVCWCGLTKYVPVSAHNPMDYKQHQFHAYFNHWDSII